MLESQLRLTVVLGFWHSLYTLPEVIVPISGVHLSDTFRYFLLSLSLLFEIWYSTLSECCCIMKCTLYGFLVEALIILCHSTLLIGEPPSPISTPWGHTGLCSHAGAIPYYYLPFRTTIIHTIMLGKQKYGGWAYFNGPHPHMFFYMHQSYRNDSTHPSLFNKLGTSQGKLWFTSCLRVLLG